MATRRRALMFLTIPGAVLLGVWGATFVPPIWWRPPPRDDPATADLAQRVESGLIEQAHLIRGDPAPWRIRITQAQVNAWLAARLPKWMDHARPPGWPDGLAAVQAHLREGELSLGFQLEGRLISRVAAVHLTPRLIDGRLQFSIDGCGLGLIPAPRRVAVDRVTLPLGAVDRDRASDPLEQLAKALLRRETIDPALKLSDGRTIVLIGLHVRPGELILTCQTWPAPTDPRADPTGGPGA